MSMNSRFSQRDVTSRGNGPSVQAAGDGREGAYSATVHAVPSGGLCKVVIGAFSLTQFETAHCSPSLTAHVGDFVLVVFDENKDPWVVANATR
jgi:hypothetical protein